VGGNPVGGDPVLLRLGRVPAVERVPFAIGLLVQALGQVTHGTLYLVAFAAGITIATCGPKQRESRTEVL